MKEIPVRQITANLKVPSSEPFKIQTLEGILAGNDLKQDLHRHDFFLFFYWEMAAAAMK